MIAKNYIGVRFGTRVCIGQEHVPRRGARLTMRCDCGRVSRMLLSNARGCIACKQIKHGHSRTTPTYRTWTAMLQRCKRKAHPAYASYGGNGIAVCEKWLNFKGFLDDMGERPEGMSIDRIDNSKGYFKENCRWATSSQQARNRNTNRHVTINGETKLLIEWAESSGIPFSVLRKRMEAKWSEDRLLSPVRVRPAARNQAGR